MLRSTLLLILGIAIQLTTFSQCIDSTKIKWGGDYGFINYIRQCPTYNFAYGGDTSKHWNVLDDAIDIMQAPIKVIELKHKVDAAIKNYAGKNFYSDVRFNSVEVVYPDKLKTFTDSGRGGLTLKYCKAKYFFYYTFQPDRIGKGYLIGVAVDKYGKIISPFTFPSKNDYKPIDKTYTYCKLIDIARSTQKNINPIDEISLNYDKKNKRFYWFISQAIVDTHEGINYINVVTIDAANLSRAKTYKSHAMIIY